MIITDPKLLQTKCEDVKLEEANSIIELLESELKKSEENGRRGIGLAAPQIGIYKKAAIVRIDDKYKANLLNAKIENGYDQLIFNDEGCLSFPDTRVNTKRYNEIYVVNNLTYPNKFIATGLFSVCIQHELDHLEGITLLDRQIKQIIKQKPNELCLCGSNKKFKKCCYLKI